MGLGWVNNVWRGGPRECRLFKPPVEVGLLHFPMAKGPLQMHSALSCCRGVGVLAKIGGLGQVESNQLINNGLDILRA
jgi:hypothetical protein